MTTTMRAVAFATLMLLGAAIGAVVLAGALGSAALTGEVALVLRNPGR